LRDDYPTMIYRIDNLTNNENLHWGHYNLMVQHERVMEIDLECVLVPRQEDIILMHAYTNNSESLQIK